TRAPMAGRALAVARQPVRWGMGDGGLMSYLSQEHDALRSKMRRARVVKVDDSGTQQKLDLRGLPRGWDHENVRRRQAQRESDPDRGECDRSAPGRPAWAAAVQ